MSIAIATMGKFIPATGTAKVVEKIIDRGSSYGGEWNKRKPQVVVNRVEYKKEEEKLKPDILITGVEEE